jgi:hypothetical protein
MNSKTTIIGLVAAIAVLSGAMGLSVTGAFSDQTIAKFAPNNIATGMLMGQVMIEAHNTNGELIAYRIGDNEVVDDGEQCILKMLFGTTGMTNAGRGQYLATTGDGSISATVGACTGILTGAWDVIAIGTGTLMCVEEPGADADPGNCDDIPDHDYLTIMGAESVDNGLERKAASTKTWTNGTGGATATQIVLKHTFTTDGAAATIYESGLFNSTQVGGSGMLAHKTFAGVVLANGDSITVQWTFVVGN